jgi:hypothetical protein
MMPQEIAAGSQGIDDGFPVGSAYMSHPFVDFVLPPNMVAPLKFRDRASTDKLAESAFSLTLFSMN